MLTALRAHHVSSLLSHCALGSCERDFPQGCKPCFCSSAMDIMPFPISSSFPPGLSFGPVSELAGLDSRHYPFFIAGCQHRSTRLLSNDRYLQSLNARTRLGIANSCLFVEEVDRSDFQGCLRKFHFIRASTSWPCDSRCARGCCCSFPADVSHHLSILFPSESVTDHSETFLLKVLT